VSVLPDEAKYMLGLFCLWLYTFGWNGHLTITTYWNCKRQCWGLGIWFNLKPTLHNVDRKALTACLLPAVKLWQHYSYTCHTEPLQMLWSAKQLTHSKLVMWQLQTIVYSY